MEDYFIGVDLCGADPVYGPLTPEQLTHVNRPLNAAEQAAVSEYKAAHPSFLQREAFGGVKTWQVILGGAGLASILGGVIALAVRKR